MARNTATVLVFRFLGGVLAACPLSNSGCVDVRMLNYHILLSFYRALISDLWDAKTRGNALAIFAVMPFAGPSLGPAVAGFIGERVDWRWVFWILTILVSVQLLNRSWMLNLLFHQGWYLSPSNCLYNA